MSLKITAPVTLNRDAETIWLQVESGGKHAAINLAEISNSPFIKEAFGNWADAQFLDAMLHRRRKTGVKDVTGTLLLEGDIVQPLSFPNYYIDSVFGVVTWSAEKAAFVFKVVVEGGGIWESDNLGFSGPWEMKGLWRIVGNVFQSANLLKPAKPLPLK